MAFTEHRIEGSLAAFVDCLWRLQSASSEGEDTPHLVAPDGCVEIVVALEGSMRLGIDRPAPTTIAGGDVAILGLATRPHRALCEGRVDLVGVRMTPVGAMRMFGGALASFTDAIVRGEDWSRERARRLVDDAARQRLTQTLGAWLDRSPRTDRRIEPAVAMITAARGTVRVADVAAELSLSPRQLHRRFFNSLGVAPKMLARIVRFESAFRLGLDGQRGEWAGIAARCGYADQAHLTRDFIEFTGAPPETLRSARES